MIEYKISNETNSFKSNYDEMTPVSYWAEECITDYRANRGGVLEKGTHHLSITRGGETHSVSIMVFDTEPFRYRAVA